MRIVTYGAACSLDGFITGPDGSLDWLHFSKDVQDVMATYWATIDTVLMGRKTWVDAMARTGGSGSSDDDEDGATDEGGEPAPGMTGITTYVFSRTLKKVRGPATHLVSSDAGDFVRDLKQQPGKGICVMGGGELAQSLFAADVIDEVGLNIHPVILGSGVPFFRDPGRRIALTLLEARTLQGGCVLATYGVAKPAAKRKAAKGRRQARAAQT